MKDATHKLSKRFGDANFEDFIAKGYLPEAIVNYIALLGWSPKDDAEKMSMDELIERFSVDGVSKSGSIFDEPKMKWLNGLYVHEMSPEDFSSHSAPWYEKSVVAGTPENYKKWDALLQSRIDIFSEIPEKVEFIAHFGEYDINMYYHKKLKADPETALKALKFAASEVEKIDDYNAENLQNAFRVAAEEAGMKSGLVMWSVRIAVTGAAVTPGGAAEMADILGKEETLKRLAFSVKLLEEHACKE